MKIALYIGNHSTDSWFVRVGWYLTRKFQKGKFNRVTHVEAIHQEHADGSVTMASSSLRDGGVRQRCTRLNPKHWLIVDVEQWGVDKSIDFLHKTEGRPYDWRGALATVLPGSQQSASWFCNEWVGSPYLLESATFTPSQFTAVCMSLGKDVTAKFFSGRCVTGLGGV